MKLRISIIPLIIFALFGYGVVKVDQNTNGGKNPIDGKALKAAIVKDYHDAVDNSVADYSHLNR